MKPSWSEFVKGGLRPCNGSKSKSLTKRITLVALLEMSRRGRIDCYADRVYIVPEPALELLADLKIKYKELGRGRFDYAEKTLRDTLAAHT